MWPDGARCGLTWDLATAVMAGRGLKCPCACGRWLPVWPRDLISNANVRMPGSRFGHRILSPATSLNRMRGRLCGLR